MSLKTLRLLGNEISTLLRMTAADETRREVKAILGQFATEIDRELSAIWLAWGAERSELVQYQHAAR